MMSGARKELSRLLGVATMLRDGGGLDRALAAVARTIAGTLGYGTVAINLYRPAWDDYEVVAVHGSQAARDALLGSRTTNAEWESLIDERYRLGSAYFIPAGSYDWDNDDVASYVPDLPASRAPDGWDPEDALFATMRDSTGAVIGVLSVDEPLSGRRPTAEECDVLAAVAAQAALAAEAAQREEEASAQGAAVEHLLRVSATLTANRDIDEILTAVCTGIRDALGFQKVSVHLDDPPHGLVTRAAVGWKQPPAPARELAQFGRLLAPEYHTEGCVLIDRETAHRLIAPELRDGYRSELTGHGPRAWTGHWLCVPLHEPDGSLSGFIWADDPADRLIPSRGRLQALRAFANQAVSALRAARHVEDLRDLARHDPMTGLRNRRGLDQQIEGAVPGGAALIVFDVDRFKAVNDRLGYEVGDLVIRSVARILEAGKRADDVAVRLGGEEFALLLPGARAEMAVAAAERIRGRVRDAVSQVPWELTLSAGVAATGPELAGGEALLRAATRALHAAKRMGRDRCVVYGADTLEALVASLDDASTLDLPPALAALLAALGLRDPDTARHAEAVGRLAEAVARELGWSRERAERLRLAGMVHDLGKLAVPEAVLHKPGPLDEAEWHVIRRHPEAGARLLEDAGLPDLAAWVLAHHERPDGTGYPAGLAAAAIPPEARILSVVDAWEAMISTRPYRTGMAAENAHRELEDGRGTQFDPDVVDALVRVLGAR